MNKKIIFLCILLLLSFNIIFAGEFELLFFGSYQTSTDAIGLGVGVGTGYNFNPISSIIAPGFSFELSFHPLSIISETKVGGIGAAANISFLFNYITVKPLFGCNWTFAAGLNNMEPSKGDIFNLLAGLELIFFRKFGIEYCFFLPDPSLSIRKNDELNNHFENHRFRIIYHHRY